MTRRMMAARSRAIATLHVIENAKRPFLVFVHCIAF
jgi:hypothetical protein